MLRVKSTKLFYQFYTVELYSTKSNTDCLLFINNIFFILIKIQTLSSDLNLVVAALNSLFAFF